MLELICNAVLLTIGVVLALRLGLSSQRRSDGAVRALALLCLLLVLFPVISVSDDLHTPEAALSDVSRSGDQTSITTTVDHNTSVTVALATSATAIRLHFLHFAEPTQRQRAQADIYFLVSDALRAPPAVL
jgi:hypothetical protein